MRHKNIITIIGLLTWLGAVPGSAALADEAKLAPLTAFDPVSTEIVDHDFWNLILQGIVYERKLVLKAVTNATPPTGTRVKQGPAKNTGVDVNYVPYQLVKTEFKQYRFAITQYIGDVRRVQVSHLNRNEQLAFWLNLRNALLLRMIFDHHPLSKSDLKTWYFGTGGAAAQWDEPAVTVEGVRLSLRDIETLVADTWKDPRVLYGFFYGAKGGPFLMNEAFEGSTVYAQLDRNGRDYLNSTFAVKATSKGIAVPEPLKWYPVLFANEAAAMAHIRQYANGGLLKKLDQAGAAPVTYSFDWALNDLPSKLRPDTRLQLSAIAGISCAGAVNEGGAC